MGLFKRYLTECQDINYGIYGIKILISTINILYVNYLDKWINEFCKEINREYLVYFSDMKNSIKKESLNIRCEIICRNRWLIAEEWWYKKLVS